MNTSNLFLQKEGIAKILFILFILYALFILFIDIIVFLTQPTASYFEAIALWQNTLVIPFSLLSFIIIIPVAIFSKISMVAGIFCFGILVFVSVFLVVYSCMYYPIKTTPWLRITLILGTLITLLEAFQLLFL